jgi:AraC-like DNA-binding protein
MTNAPPSTEPTMRAVSLSNYANVARFVGLDPYDLIRQWRISSEYFHHPEARLPAATVCGLIEQSARQSGCESFGLLMVESRNFASLGPVSLLLKHSANVRAIVGALIEYRRLFNDVMTFRLEEAGGYASICIECLPGFASRQLTEGAVAMAYRVLTEALGDTWQPEAVHFRHSAPRNLAHHRRFYQCPVQFESEFDGLSCPSHWLDARNPAANAGLALQAAGLIDRLKPATGEDAVVERTRSTIYLLLPTGAATIERVAEGLGIQPRTLQRLLHKEGQTFGDVLLEVRRALAQRYLAASRHNLTDISAMLGYSSLSSFTRWFGAEFGRPPAAWRAEALAQAASATI